MEAASEHVGDSSFFEVRAVRNLIIVRSTPGNPWPAIPSLRNQMKTLRQQYPKGMAILNIVGRLHAERPLEAWVKMVSILFSGPEKPTDSNPPEVLLGVAHWAVPVGLRASLWDVGFRLVIGRGDFAKQGHEIVRDIDDATDWLASLLKKGPEVWTAAQIREAIAEDVPDMSGRI